MLSTRASRRAAVIYAVMIAVSLLLLAVSGTAPITELRRGVGFALSPIQQALASGTRTVTSVFAAFGQVEELRADSQRLQERIQMLEVENRRLEQARVENQQLNALLQLRSTLDYDSVAAAVIGRGASESERVITLDQGSDRGIQADDVVLAAGGALVGQVVDVGRDFSHVRLISDTRSVVIGLIETSRATGDVQGQLSRALVMSRIPATDVVNINETVVTAGIDLGNDIRSPFPKGLLIGTVVDVQKDPNAVVQAAFLVPAAPLDRLEAVLVVTGYERQPTPRPSTGPGGSPVPSPSGSRASRKPSASASPSPITLPTPTPTLPPAP
jgi:rod shape-determining protein MreC